jgi:hypothetical protein
MIAGLISALQIKRKAITQKSQVKYFEACESLDSLKKSCLSHAQRLVPEIKDIQELGSRIA